MCFRDFYQLKQERNEKVQIYSVRLREAYKKLTTRFPKRFPLGDEDRILCDRFFYGMRPDLKNGVRHLYDSENCTFGTLLTLSRRVEDEETVTRVSAKGTVVDPVDQSSDDLRKQIEKVVKTVVKSNQFRGKRKGNSDNKSQKFNKKNPNDETKFEAGSMSMDIRQTTSGPGTSSAGPFAPHQRPIQCYRCHGWGHVARLCVSQLNYMRGGEGEGRSSPKSQVRGGRGGSHSSSSANRGLSAFGAAVEDRYHNPDAVVRLVGPANESVVVLEGKRLKALIDSGAQLSSIPISLVRKLRLRLFHLDTIIEAERTGGGLVQYHGYVEVRLQIPGIKTMDMDTLFMVVDDSPYTDRVPVQLGTLQIDEAIKRATEKELKSLSQSWQRANFPNRLSAKGGTINKPTFDLTKAKGTVKLLKKVTINPFDTVYVTGKTKFKDHYKRLNIIVSAVKDGNYTTVIPVNTYTCMKPGSIRVTFALRNLSSRKVEVPAKSVTAKFIAANAVPKMLAPKDEPKQDSVKEQQVLTPEQEKRFFEKLDLSGNQEWPSELREKTKNLFRRYGYLFALENLDLGHTSLVKHKIRLTDNTPFKE